MLDIQFSCLFVFAELESGFIFLKSILHFGIQHFYKTSFVQLFLSLASCIYFSSSQCFANASLFLTFIPLFTSREVRPKFMTTVIRSFYIQVHILRISRSIVALHHRIYSRFFVC